MGMNISPFFYWGSTRWCGNDVHRWLEFLDVYYFLYIKRLGLSCWMSCSSGIVLVRVNFERQD